MERTMQECRRVSGAFDCAYPASNGGIKDYGSRSSEVRCQKTDLEIRWLSGSDSHRNETVGIRRPISFLSFRLVTVASIRLVSTPLNHRISRSVF